MEKKIDLVEILKDCPMGTKLYSCLHGEVEFCNIVTDSGFPISVLTKLNYYPSFTSDGRYLGDGYEGECVLFPSKDNRDWSTFVAPKKKVERFDPKTLKPFEKVLVRNNGFSWEPRFFSLFGYRMKDRSITDTAGRWWEHAIPYEGNEELYLTTNEPDEYYRYWED
jgi:hypothetical protein